MMPEQRRGRSIAMNADELDSFLGKERSCRLATLGAGGPHVSPVWFVWDGTALWIYSLTRSQRWTDIARDPRVAAVIDAGHEYAELRGVEIEGDADRRRSRPAHRPRGSAAPELAVPERLMAAKYSHGGELAHDGRHAWLRVTPGKMTSWDFRKLAARPGRGRISRAASWGKIVGTPQPRCPGRQSPNSWRLK